jgi:hypothetical protein
MIKMIYSKCFPAWGPYGKKYMGISRIADHAFADGVRFDVTVAPAIDVFPLPVFCATQPPETSSNRYSTPVSTSRKELPVTMPVVGLVSPLFPANLHSRSSPTNARLSSVRIMDYLPHFFVVLVLVAVGAFLGLVSCGSLAGSAASGASGAE